MEAKNEKIVFVGPRNNKDRDEFVGKPKHVSSHMNFKIKDMRLLDGTPVNLQCWGSADQEGFEALPRTTYANSLAVVFTFDPKIKETLNYLKVRYNEFKAFFPDQNVLLFLTTTSDLSAEDLETYHGLLQEAKDFANEKQIKFLAYSELKNKLTEEVEKHLEEKYGFSYEIVEEEEINLKKLTISGELTQEELGKTLSNKQIEKLNQAFEQAATEYGKKAKTLGYFSASEETQLKKYNEAMGRKPEFTNKDNLYQCFEKLEEFLDEKTGDNLNSYKYQVVNQLFNVNASTDEEAKNWVNDASTKLKDAVKEFGKDKDLGS